MSEKKQNALFHFHYNNGHMTAPQSYTYVAYLVCNDYNFRRQAGQLRNHGFC